MKVDCTCQYCGMRFEKIIYSLESAKSIRCPKCGDRTIKVRDVDKTKVNQYPEEDEKDDWP